MKKHIAADILNFYIEGFRAMRLGRVLWLIIIVKLFIMFFILKLFFFPDVISGKGDKGQQTEFVAEQLIERSAK